MYSCVNDGVCRIYGFLGENFPIMYMYRYSNIEED